MEHKGRLDRWQLVEVSYCDDAQAPKGLVLAMISFSRLLAYMSIALLTIEISSMIR